ncbi:MAG: ribosome maturation factor RimP [Burkholderiales bacterium]|nr:ribosome maturation factor RimP [Burkholderiales bacterium]
MSNLKNILEQTIPGLGFELVDYEMAPARIIRIYIDKPNGVNVDDCEAVSNHLTKLFLVENIEFNRLEVSSPGVERPLKKIEDFKRFVNKLAKIKTHEAINENKIFQGIIVAVDGSIIKLRDEANQEFEIDFQQINRARLVFEYKKNKSAKLGKGKK